MDWADDRVVVVDSRSSDATEAIAREMGARVVVHPFTGTIEQKNVSLEHAKHDWVLALDAGIDAARIPEALAGGRADSAILQEYMPRMVERNFEPMGTVAIILKDLETVADLARETGTAMPLAKLVTELNRLLVAKGHGGEDNAAMIRLYDGTGT